MNQNYQSLNDFYKLDKITFNKKATAKQKNEYSKIINIFHNETSVYSKLAEAMIYLKLGREAKSESILSSIMDKEYIYYLFQQEFNEKENEKINDFFMNYLNQLNDLLENEKLIENLTAFLAIELNENEREVLFDDFSIPNRLSYVQEHTKSISYGIYYPHVWSFWLEKYSSTEELRLFLERGNIKETIGKDPKAISLLYSFYPLDKEFRDLIYQSYKTLLGSSISYETDIAIRMHENSSFVNELKLRKHNKPIFILRRNHYRKSLKNLSGIYYSIYNLMKLGEIEKSFLPYLLAVKSYGL